MAKTILVVEDDQNISELLRLYLEKEGYTVNIADDGGKGVELYRRLKPDLVLLDLMLPVLDGWGVLRAIRQDGKTPVIMLTAKGETIDKVAGLKQGADDYITKPFEMKEVLARIEAVLRRAGEGENGKEKPRRLVFDKLVIDLDSFELVVDGKRVETPPKEMELLYHLASSPNRVYTRNQLLDEVWGFDYFATAAPSTCISSGFARSLRACRTSGASRRSGASGISSRSCSNENNLLPALFDDRGAFNAVPAHYRRGVPVSDDELGGIRKTQKSERGRLGACRILPRHMTRRASWRATGISRSVCRCSPRSERSAR